MCDALLRQKVCEGEALSLKGIIELNLGKKLEGLELARKGCKVKISSGFCWHILGLIYKALHNHDDAIKSFKTSLRNDADNITVMKDIANSSIQTRDYYSNFDMRKRIVLLRPLNILHWNALLIASLLESNCLEHGLLNILKELYDSTDIFSAELVAEIRNGSRTISMNNRNIDKVQSPNEFSLELLDLIVNIVFLF